MKKFLVNLTLFSLVLTFSGCFGDGEVEKDEGDEFVDISESLFIKQVEGAFENLHASENVFIHGTQNSGFAELNIESNFIINRIQHENKTVFNHENYINVGEAQHVESFKTVKYNEQYFEISFPEEKIRLIDEETFNQKNKSFYHIYNPLSFRYSLLENIRSKNQGESTISYNENFVKRVINKRKSEYFYSLNLFSDEAIRNTEITFIISDGNLEKVDFYDSQLFYSINQGVEEVKFSAYYEKDVPFVFDLYSYFLSEDSQSIALSAKEGINFRTFDHLYKFNSTSPFKSELVTNYSLEGLRGSVFRRSGLEPVALYDSGGVGGWTNNTSSGGFNDSEIIPNTDGKFDSGHNLFYKAFEQEDTNDEYSWAQERNHYGRWDIEIMTFEGDKELYINDDTVKTSLMINGENNLPTISDYRAITPEQRKRDFLRAFEVKIFEMDFTEEGLGQSNHEGFESSEENPLPGYSLVTHGTFEEHKKSASEPSSSNIFKFDWSHNSLGEFNEDIPRSFAIVYFINGHAGSHHSDNQTHIKDLNFSFSIDLNLQ